MNADNRTALKFVGWACKNKLVSAAWSRGSTVWAIRHTSCFDEPYHKNWAGVARQPQFFLCLSNALFKAVDSKCWESKLYGDFVSSIHALLWVRRLQPKVRTPSVKSVVFWLKCDISVHQLPQKINLEKHFKIHRTLPENRSDFWRKYLFQYIW